MQQLTVTDDRTLIIDASAKEITLLKMPAAVVQAVTTNPAMQVKSQGRHVMVSAAGGPGDLVVLTHQQAYTFRLTPKPIPAETVVVVDARSDASTDADPAKQAADYEDGVIELLQQVIQGGLPKSYSHVAIPPEAYPAWLELSVVSAVEYRGVVYRVFFYELKNPGKATLTLRETEFFTGSQLAIALDKQVIPAGEHAKVYLIEVTPPTPVRDGRERTEAESVPR